MDAPFAETIDIKTLVVAAMVVYVGSFAFSLALYLVRRTFPGARQWILGQAFLVLGALGTGAEIFGMPYGVLVVANVSMLASMLFMGHAIWLFRARTRFPLLLYFILPASVVIWFAFGDDGLLARIVYFSGMLSALSAWNASLLLRKPDRFYHRVFVSAAVFFIMGSAAGLLRVFGILLGSVPPTLADQGRMSMLVYVIAILGAFFNLFGYFLMSAVRTEKELLETELAVRQRNERLNRLVGMKDALITVVGHDLRAPIASAARYTRNHLLNWDGDLNQKRESIATLAEGLERAATLLANLVDWARSASGRVEFELERVSLSMMATEAARDLAAVAERKGLSILVPGEPAFARADPRAAATVFRNIIANAIKYSRPAGTIELGFGTAPGGMVEASVTDHGVGMDRAQIDTLFEPGRTVQTLGTDGEQGTGMGLALCKAFMEAMGGDIKVSSEPGKGSRFQVLFQPLSGETAGDQEPETVLPTP